MGTTLREKGWGTTVWMQLAVVVAWFGGMLVAGFGYGVYLGLYLGITGGSAAADPTWTVLYPLCLLAAAAGGGLLFTIVSFFPSHELPRTWTITAEG